MISRVVENVIRLRNCKRKMFSEVGVSTEQRDADQCIPAHCFRVASQYSEVSSSFSSIIIVLNSCYANNAMFLCVVLSVLQLHHAYGNTTLPTHPCGVYWCQRMREENDNVIKCKWAASGCETGWVSESCIS